MLMAILLILLLLALFGGGWGHRRYGYMSWSPVLLVLMVLVVLAVTGGLAI